MKSRLYTLPQNTHVPICHYITLAVFYQGGGLFVYHTTWIFTSAKEDMFSSLFVCLFVCLFVSNFAQKLPNGFAWNFQRGQWTNHEISVVIRITDPDPDPYRNSRKTCLDGGIHCPSASSLNRFIISLHIAVVSSYQISCSETITWKNLQLCTKLQRNLRNSNGLFAV